MIPLTTPVVQVTLEPFAIDRHEVTNLQYEYCVAMGSCTDPSGWNGPGLTQGDYYKIDKFNHHPVMFVTWEQADAYCSFAGRRLPTEIEWERVARGNPDNIGASRTVPSDAFDSLEACKSFDVASFYCSGKGDVAAVDQPGDDFVMEAGQKIHHLFANVAEWTADWHDDYRTCKDDLPEECTSLLACKSQTGAAADKCQQEANVCAGCDSLPEGEICHQGCEGTSRSYFTCVTWTEDSQPLEASAVDAAQGTRRVVRGGSSIVSEKWTCRFRSDYRGEGTEFSPTLDDMSLGFRCAVDL